MRFAHRPYDYESLLIRRVMGSFPLFTRKGPQPQIRFGDGARSVLRDAVTEVIGTAPIPALAHHPIQPAGAQGRITLEDLLDEGEVRIEHRAAQEGRRHRDPRLLERATDGAVMDVQLARNGPDPPRFGVIEPHHLGLEFA